MRIITKGATSKSIYVVILDSTSTTGGKKTGLVFNTSGLTAYYALNGSASVAITLATLAAASSAYSSGGFKEVDATNMPGVYRLDVPNAALTGADSVVVTLTGATGMVSVNEEIQLSGLDLMDTVRAALTALPNAAAGGASGLPLGDASARVDIGKVLGTAIATPATAGIIDVNVKNWVNATPDALSSGKVPGDLKLWLTVAPNALSSGKVDAITIVRAGTAQAGAAGTITLDAGSSATDNLYRGFRVSIFSGTGAGQSRYVLSYVGSTKVATIVPNWTTNPDNTSVFVVETQAGVDIEAWLNTAVTAATAGIPDVNTKNIANAAAALDANNLLKVDTEDWKGGVIPAVNVTGVPLVDDKYLLGTIYSTPATAGIQDINVKNMNNVAATAITTVKAVQGLTTADTITTATNLTNAPTAGDFTATMKTSLNSATPTASLSAGDSPVLQSGTATAGGASTITIQTAIGADSLPVGCKIKLTGGTGAKQSRVITGYVDSTKVVTVDRAWTTNPDATTVYTILFDEAPALSAALKVTGVVTTDTATNLTNAPGAGDFTATMKTSLNNATPVATVSGDFSATMKTSLNAATPVASLSGDLTPTMKTSVTTAATAATPTIAGYTGNTPQTGDAYARLGAPTGASTAADIATVNGKLPSALVGGRMDSNTSAINNSNTAAVRLALSAAEIIPFSVTNAGFSPTATEFETDVNTAGTSFYNGCVVIWTSGSLAGQRTSVSAYSVVGGRGHFTVVAMTAAPANGDAGILV